MNDPREAAMQAVAPVLDAMLERPGLWYVTSPYRNYPTGSQEAWKGAVRLSAAFLKAGLVIYSPVIHFHPIFTAGRHVGGFPTTSAFWQALNIRQREAAAGLVILQMPAWDESETVSLDQIDFELNDKPVLFMPVERDFDPEADRLHAAHRSRHVRR